MRNLNHWTAKEVPESEVKVLVAQLYLTLCDHMGYNPPRSSLLGILQARILEWVAILFSKGAFPTQGSNPGGPYSIIFYEMIRW